MAGNPKPTFVLRLPNSGGPPFEIPSVIGYKNFGEIISDILPFAFVIAGLILFFLIVLNGLKLLTSSGDPKTTEVAKHALTAAVIGFLLIISSYWIIQIVEFILNINILGN